MLDTDDNVPGQRVLRFDLKNGWLSRDWGRSPIDWAALRRDSTAFVDLAKDRYSFRADQVIRTDPGVAAQWDTSRAIRSISAVWGGRPFGAAIEIGNDLFLFTADRFSRLAKSAADGNGLSAVVTNLGNALARRTPIRGSVTNLPSSFLDGFDAALSADGSLYLFKSDQYVRLSGDLLPQLVTSLKYDIVRLTTSTAARLNRELFLGGVERLLSLRTQEVADTPGFSATTSSPTTIHVNADRVNIDALPPGDHLDFGSANGVYLWEIFFHGPALIADMLSTAQRFEEARAWYEHIFDPTEPGDAWRFLPFLSEDVERIVLEIRNRLDRLDQAKVNVADLRGALTAPGEFGKLIAIAPKLPDQQNLTDEQKADLDRQSVLDTLLAMDLAFQGERNLIDPEPAALDALTLLPVALAEPLKSVAERTEPDLKAIGAELRELVDLVASLRNCWDGMQTMRAQIKSYLDDPFDPHAIATLRPIAYRKAIVMRYLDNLLNWGDMLFSQYTRDSITEARMLYVEAWDVLGRRPESLGRRILSADSVYDALRDAHPGEYDMLIQLEGSRTAQLSFAGSLLPTGSDVRGAPYFFIPPSDELDQYWTRVADRLYKIRNNLNILGVQQPLALFEPPLNPMALVRAVAGAGGLAGLVDGAAVDVPHYRFSFLVAKAQSLVQTITQLGSELLGVLEKRDAEAMGRLQTLQEGATIALTRDMQKSQLEESQTNLQYLEKARDNAQKRRDVYQSWIDVGYLPMEGAQIGLLAGAVGVNVAAAALNAVAAGLALIPKSHIGLFTFGIDTPDFHQGVQYIGNSLQTAAGAIQGIGEILGITAQHERSMQDWSLQRDLATIDMAQIDAQIEGAKWQIEAARQQIAITERQIQHNKAVSDFYHSKFTNQELYEWMAGRLSEIHYQTYQLALDMARAAERSFQFERGRKQVDSSFIQGQQWDSQRRGLLAGYGLGLALSRMESAHIATDAQRFEICKTISLLRLDPMAFLKLKADGVCEFEFGEALFDYDFPGHYCRQVKTIAVDLALGDGVFANATLTQLTSRVVIEPDAKAVGFLFAPKETPPLSIRSNWKAQQQIALSSHTQDQTNSGMFELRFDSDRFLPFEGTGAVSRWRLGLGGPPGAYDLGALTGVTITLKYSALQGGDAFAAAVRGLLKPTDVLRAFNLSTDFADAWQGFIGGDADVLDLPLTPANFPNMAGGAIRAIFARYEYQSTAQGTASFVIDMGVQLPLPDGKTVDTSGLTVRATGTTLRLRVSGDKSSLRNAYLLMSYKGGVR